MDVDADGFSMVVDLGVEEVAGEGGKIPKL